MQSTPFHSLNHSTRLSSLWVATVRAAEQAPRPARMRWHRRTTSASSQYGVRFIRHWGLWHHPRLLNYLAVFLASFFAILLNLLSYYLSHHHSLTSPASAALIADAKFLLPSFNQRERHAARRLGVSLTRFSAQSSAYFLCPDCAVDNDSEPRHSPKLVALVELRNVAESLDSFLTAIEQVVDGVVALDDHSDDGTRALLLERCLPAAARSPRCKLDALIVKTGDWVRQELLDRDLLLHAGRAVGGTHFVLLDYDERFVGDCVNNGVLRNTIVGLPPGHSLFLPWVELWKNPAVHRVLPSDRNINFLVRRQTVIFADDRRTNYSMESAHARSLGAHNASIHALRCPRSVCPQPPRYRGPNTPSIPLDGRVHRNPPGCAITETRFMHIPNVMLKAAWYQALSRVLDADSSTTRGKMLDALFPAESPWGLNKLRGRSSYSQSGIALSITPGSWFSPTQAQDILSLRHIERWRAGELVDWLGRLGDAQFSDLSALQYFDLSALRHAAARAFFASPTRPWEHVPRWKRGTFVIAVGDGLEADVMAQILARFGEAVDVQLADIAENSEFMAGLGRNSFQKRLNSKTLGYEDWRLAVVIKVRAALSQSRNGVAYTSARKLSVDHFASLVEFASKEFDQFDVVFLFATGARELEKESRANDSEIRLKCAMNASLKPGSHIRVLAINSASLGSYSAVTWLRYRITGKVTFAQDEAERKELLKLTERINARLRRKYKTEAEVMPVARMIFSLNVGRSGSKYLAGMFSSLGRAVRGLHEPRCAGNKCSGGGAIAMQYKKLKDTYEERYSVKIPMLETAIIEMGEEGVKEVAAVESVGYENRCDELIERQAKAESRVVIETNSETGCSGGWLKDYVYSETNPNFKSWFYDVTLDTMPRRGYSLSVIVLRKYHAAALKSLYETGYFTNRNGYNWMETGNGVNSRVRAIRSDKEMDAFDKIISYLFNAEAVMRYVIEKYGAVARFVEVRSEDIYSEKGTIELLKRLGLSRMHLTASTLDLAGKRADKYGSGPGHAKRRMITSIDECERRIATYLATSASQRITSIPRNMTQLRRYRGFTYL